MKTVIVCEDFDKKSGISTVTIQNKYGHFNGTAWCHPDDMNNFSMFQGERIALNRANINFCKHRIVQEKAKLKVLKELYSPYYENFLKKTFNNKIKECKETIENYQNSIIILKNSIKLMDEERQKILQRSKKNK